MNINVWAVIVAAIINMVIGSLWYSKALFADAWLKEIGKKMGDLGSPNMGYMIATIAALVQAWVLAVVIHWRGADTLGLGLKVGLLVWLGFVATSYAAMYTFEKRSQKLYAINAGYYLVVLLINGALLGTWQ